MQQKLALRNSAPPSMRGSSDLLGYDPTNVLTDEDTTAIEYELAPGQKDDANIGVILDFENIDNPQPIRGTKGGTDPGPSKFLEYHLPSSRKVDGVRVFSANVHG